MQQYLKYLYDKNKKIDNDHNDIIIFENNYKKMNNEAIQLFIELIRLYTVEAFHRSKHEAIIDESLIIESEHIERIIFQLFMDF